MSLGLLGSFALHLEPKTPRLRVPKLDFETTRSHEGQVSRKKSACCRGSPVSAPVALFLWFPNLLSTSEEITFLGAGVGGSPATTGLIHPQRFCCHCHGRETTSALLTTVWQCRVTQYPSIACVRSLCREPECCIVHRFLVAYERCMERRSRRLISHVVNVVLCWV